MCATLLRQDYKKILKVVYTWLKVTSQYIKTFFPGILKYRILLKCYTIKSSEYSASSVQGLVVTF